jgi:hypothetical protein
LLSRLKNFFNRKAPPQANFFSDAFGLSQQPQQQAPAPRVVGYGPALCASATKVYYGRKPDDEAL